MSQHDFNIANQSFPATRTDLNNALQALASNSSGDAEPSTTFANQWWYETDTNTLKLRNEANNAWLSFATVDQSTAAWTLAHDVDVTGTVTADGADLDGAVIINEAGADVDFRVESDTVDHALFVQGSDGYVGIGTSSPATALDVTGTVTADGLTTNTLGTSNFIAGVNAGNSIISGGNYNVVVGDEAGTAITTGDNNVAVGYQSLVSNTTASNNTAVGYQAAYTNTTGTGLVAVGTDAFYSVTSAANSVAVGKEALYYDTTGESNVAMGFRALYSNTTASNNTAVGYQSLYANTTGDINVAVGKDSMLANTTGTNNTALGARALQSNTTAVNNVAVGDLALSANTTGIWNTAIGTSAADGNTTGSGNTIIGAACDVTAAGANYAMGLGYNLECAAGYTTLGESGTDIRAAHGVATWAAVSDERVKKDIEDSTVGLSFINDLRPRTFNYRNKGDIPEEFKGYEEGSIEVYKSSTTNYGFIAQEVKEVIDNHTDIVDGFKLWDVRETGQQEVAEAALIPMLVKAIQELSAKNDALTARITALEGN